MRRLSLTVALLSTAAVSCGGGGSGGHRAPDGPYTPPAGTRTDAPIDDGWLFLRADAAGAEAVGFDESAWTPVALPHTWNAFDGEDGGNDYYRGVGWYRRHLTAPPSSGAPRRTYLQLDGASMVADVYVNGAHAGQHRGGFASFRFDVTDLLDPNGGDNVIAVKADNSSVPDVAPLSADFTFFGGLYRDVHLITVDPLHVDLDDAGGPGLYLTAHDVGPDAAGLAARVRITNAGSAAEDPQVALDVVDAAGLRVARLTGGAHLDAGATTTVELDGTIQAPHLWDGRRDPYLYTADAEVGRAGQVVDVVAQPLGFRWFAIDPASGFALNGRHLDLHGVNRHQDRLDMGWAITNREHDEDMALIEEVGATAIRLAHYQHAQHFYDLADRAGMVVWAEVPLVNNVTSSAAFDDNAQEQLRELIRQSFNHPSIVFWSLSNELADAPDPNPLMDTMQALAHAEDPSRLTTLASDQADADPINGHTDVVGFNKYYGWYYGVLGDFATWADGVHASYPARAIGVSEFGAGAGVTLHATAPQIMDHSEEYQALFHETTWQAMRSRDFLWGKFVWNMFDFASDGRDEGETPGRNDKGLVTYDRRTKKDAFFWYKANWSDQPFVYITSRRFNPRTTDTIDVKVYSNLDNVTLTAGGLPLGTVTAPDHIFVWTAVPLAPGDNRVDAVAASAAGDVTATDSVVWTR